MKDPRPSWRWSRWNPPLQPDFDRSGGLVLGRHYSRSALASGAFGVVCLPKDAGCALIPSCPGGEPTP